MMRALAAVLVFLSLCGAASAQGCGQGNPNCLVPTRPMGDSSNSAASTAFVQQSGVGGLVVPISVYGGVGDGVTDNLPAFNAAIAAIRARPGGCGTVYISSGTWLSSSAWDVPSCIHVQGAGMNATTLLGNPSAALPLNYTMIIYATLTGTGNKGITNPVTYAINTPTQGASTVTTTTASDAGNFNAGDIINVSGSLHATNFWYPDWTTTVTGADAGTGIITLADAIPIAGSAFSLVQKILVYPQNVMVSDLTISAPAGANVGGLQASFARNVVIERVKFASMSATRHPYLALSGVRDAYVNNSTMLGTPTNGGFLDCLACSDSVVSNNIIDQSILDFDGGTFNSLMLGNTIIEPNNAGTPSAGISIVADAQFNRIIGNVLQNQTASIGVSVGTSNTATQGDNTFVGNTITGTNTSSQTGFSVGSSVNNIFVANKLYTLNTGFNFGTNSTGQIVSGNQFNNVTATVGIDATSGVSPSDNSVWTILPVNTATPNVGMNSFLATANSMATSITGFTGGVSGQTVTMLINDANTTLVSSGTFNLNQLSNYSPPSGTMMKFVNRNGNWYETSRSLASTSNYIFPRTLQAAAIQAGTGGAAGSVTINGVTGNTSLTGSTTGGHLVIASTGAATLTAGCNGAGSTFVGNDVIGRVIGQTAAATTCTISWGVNRAAAPTCFPVGETSAITSFTPATTGLVVNFASTANFTFDYFCNGA